MIENDIVGVNITIPQAKTYFIDKLDYISEHAQKMQLMLCIKKMENFMEITLTTMAF